MEMYLFGTYLTMIAIIILMGARDNYKIDDMNFDILDDRFKWSNEQFRQSLAHDVEGGIGYWAFVNEKWLSDYGRSVDEVTSLSKSECEDVSQ